MELARKKDSQITQQTSYQPIQITKPSDLLKSKPISVSIKNHGEDTVKEILMKAIVKCCAQLGIEQQSSVTETLCEDIIEVYKSDSVEDVIYALKKGRQGAYGFGFNSRNSLNLIVIKAWMENVLEEKSKSREEIIANRKHEDKKYDIHAEYVSMIEKNGESDKKSEILRTIVKANTVINKNLQKKMETKAQK